MNDQVGGNLKRDRFHALCQALRPDLLRFAFWLSRDRALAEDVVQEAMLRAWKAQDSLQDEAAAKPWLLTIIRREYARSFERKRFVTVDVDELIAQRGDRARRRSGTGPGGNSRRLVQVAGRVSRAARAAGIDGLFDRGDRR